MTVSLSGVRFDQIYGDNTGVTEFDTDGDGTATQEDEFVSFTNDSAGSIDISGWQIWSDSTGAGAPDGPQDGLYHTFPPGTVLSPGETLYVINEITGTPPGWAQEASEGGVESGAGDESTNFLTEGQAGSTSESIALVDPASGDYIVFNMTYTSSQVQNIPGFPGTQSVGEVDGHTVQADQDAGSSYQYNATSGQYEYNSVFVPCFVAGTLIATMDGDQPIEHLKTGDLIKTLDHGLQPILWIGKRVVDLTNPINSKQRPIYFENLGVSPQHRMLLESDCLAPAKGLLHLANVNIDHTAQFVVYFHLLLPQHEVIFANDQPVESLLLGPTFKSQIRMSDRIKIERLNLKPQSPARTCLTVQQARALSHAQGRFSHARAPLYSFSENDGGSIATGLGAG